MKEWCVNPSGLVTFFLRYKTNNLPPVPPILHPHPSLKQPPSNKQKIIMVKITFSFLSIAAVVASVVFATSCAQDTFEGFDCKYLALMFSFTSLVFLFFILTFDSKTNKPSLPILNLLIHSRLPWRQSWQQVPPHWQREGIPDLRDPQHEP